MINHLFLFFVIISYIIIIARSYEAEVLCMQDCHTLFTLQHIVWDLLRHVLRQVPQKSQQKGLIRKLQALLAEPHGTAAMLAAVNRKKWSDGDRRRKPVTLHNGSTKKDNQNWARIGGNGASTTETNSLIRQELLGRRLQTDVLLSSRPTKQQPFSTATKEKESIFMIPSELELIKHFKQAYYY